VLCDNSMATRQRALDKLTASIGSGYGGLFVDNAAQVPQTCTASHPHLKDGQRSDDSYLTLLGDVQAKLKTISTAPLLIANAGDISVADSTGTGSNAGAMWTIADFVLWEGFAYEVDLPGSATRDRVDSTVANCQVYGADATKAAKILALSYPKTSQEALLSFALARIFGFAWTANIGSDGTEGHWGEFVLSMPWSVGDPQGNLYVQSALLARRFTNGVVYANTGSSAVTINFPQPGTLVLADGQATVTQNASLAPHAGAVLLFQ